MRRGDDGAGTALAVGVVAAIVAVFVLVAPLVLVLEARQRAAVAADAAALAAGDVALGVATGVPCARAREIAVGSGAELRSCAQRGVLVRVEVAVPVFAGSVGARAVAGPAGARSR